MPPALPLVVAADAALADPTVRETVRQMHESGAPLLQMVDALGLDDDLSDQVRAVVAALSPEVVAGVRQATLAMLDTGGVQLPLDCSVTQVQLDDGTPVAVDVLPEQGVLTIRVRPALK